MELEDVTAWGLRIEHELGNAVWAVSGYAEMVKRSFKKGDAGRASGKLQQLQAAARRMDRLSGQMLLVAALSTEASSQPSSDLDACFRKVRHRLLATQPDRKIRGTFPGLSIGLEEPVLEAFLTEWLGNALAFTAGLITLSATTRADRIYLSLADQGPAAPSPPREEWLQPGIAQGEGLGLGLPLLAACVARAGGDFACQETPSGGSKWSADFPSGPPAPAPSQAEEPLLSSEADDLPTALVVDDQAVIRELVSHCLTTLGWRVAQAASVDAARDAVHKASPALLVLDLHLGRSSGFELATDLREQGYEGCILAFSGSDRAEVRRLGGKSCDHFDAFLEKTGSAAELTQRLRRHSPSPHKIRLGTLADSLEHAENSEPAARVEIARRVLAELRKFDPGPGGIFIP